MTPERWKEVARVYQSALSQAPTARGAFVADVCRDDSDLRREVESLLAREGAHVMVDEPVDAAAAAVISNTPGLAPGALIGPYRVMALIGQGGMGQVYRAHDTKLQREVALKILPESFVHDPDRLARFTREAQVLASLNHPNIGAIYGFEEGPIAGGPPEGGPYVHALVLELVEGPTVADRIARRPIAVDEALAIAKQIAEALEAAHEHGIVHRDLKPANIKVRDDGTVKVLDFGLAKPAGPPEGGHYVRSPDGRSVRLQPDLTNSPTIMSPAMTAMGVILGTAAYMSPEQAKGKPADKRSDIWAFGCVLYEMLTGKRAFDGDDVSDTLAAVLRGHPDWGALPTPVPTAIRSLIQRCLEKDRRQRVADISTALYVIRSPELLTSADASVPTARRSVLPWIVALAATVLAVVALSTRFLPRADGDTRVYRSLILPPSNLAGDPSGRLAISPDGVRLAFIAPNTNGRNVLWVQPLDGLTAQPLAGTEDADFPFWSPDGRFLAFFSRGELKKIGASGGPALTLSQALSQAQGRALGHGTWNRDDVILFNPGPDSPIQRVHAGGGTPTPVTVLDTSAGETSHRYPFFLPDGRHFLFITYRANAPQGVYIGSVDGPERTRLMEADSNVAYAQGHLLFLKDDTLVAQPFDVERLALAGDARPVADRVGASPGRGGIFSVSQTGTLVYQSGNRNTHLVFVGRDGAITGRLENRSVERAYSDIQFSPDGTRAAVALFADTGEGTDIWIFDLARNAPMRLTTDPALDRAPVWSPDGKQIVFQSNRNNGIFGLYQRSANGAGADIVLLEDGIEKTPWSWSPDGKYLLYSTGRQTGRDLWVLPLDGEHRTPFPYVKTPFDETEAQFSPDGRWVAFVSDETGRREVYVAAFPTPDGKWPLSTGGASFPRWRRDGRELFFENRAERELLSSAMSLGPGRFQSGRPTRLFRYVNDGARKHWDVSPDGQRFLLEAENLEGAQSDIVPITLVMNWPAALRQ